VNGRDGNVTNPSPHLGDSGTVYWGRFWGKKMQEKKGGGEIRTPDWQGTLKINSGRDHLGSALQR